MQADRRQAVMLSRASSLRRVMSALLACAGLASGCSDQHFYLQAEVEVSEELLDIARTEGRPLGISTSVDSVGAVALIVCHEQGHPERADGLYFVGYREPVDGLGLAVIGPAEVVPVTGPATVLRTHEERRCDYRELSLSAEVWTLSGIATCEDAIALEYVEEAEGEDLVATRTVTADTGDGACWRRSIQHPIDGSDAAESVEDEIEPVRVELGLEHLVSE